MKKFTRFLALITVIAVTMTSGFMPAQATEVSYGIADSAAVTAEAQEIEDATIAEYEAKAAVQREATQAYAALSATFGVTEDGATIYPDDYAGAWIEGATLYVALTSLVKNVTTKYDRIFSGFGCVVYEAAKYSLNELKDIQDAAFDVVRDTYDITAFYTEVDTNKIVFEVMDDVENVKSGLERTLNAQRFSVELDSEKTFTTDLFVIKKGDRIETEASIYGGMEINRGSSSGSGRSIGVCGTVINGSNNYAGIITAGHNLAVSGTDQTLYRNGSEFGKVSLLMWQDNGNGDWAGVRMTSSDTLTNKIYGSSSAYTRDIKDTKDDLAKGTFVMKYGFTSSYSTGTVEAQDVTADDGTYTTKGLTRCSLDSGESAGGDSGGPYYTQNTGNDYNFVGVHTGSAGSGSSKKIYFTPYVRFKTYFTVKTS